jgi:formate dehydrogenase major subunit
VEGARNPLPACATPISDGMVVATETAELAKTRQMALELMLSDHYGDCVAPCKLACPAGIDIQGYIALIAAGMYREALRLIRLSNPLPLICGRVCPRFCEQQCRRNSVDEPVAINALKRFVSDWALHSGADDPPEVKPATGKKVAVVGGGPAGLSAAYYLALAGHEAVIFDSNPELGGMMRYGIPAYRLPRDVLDSEIAGITRLCREVRCNAALGRDFTLDSLNREGYSAVFLALGAQAGQHMRIDGESQPGVISGIGFLKDIAMGIKVGLGQKVAVIGGGNTAIDAALTAVRLGAGEVTIIYRRSRDEMPASPDEIKQAEDKGVNFCFQAAPVKLGANNGRVHSLKCIRMNLGEPDSSGRRRPEPIAGSEFAMEVDTVIPAIGQSLQTPGQGVMEAVSLDARGYISIDKGTMQTSQTGIFAGGDCASGPATVVEAVAAGHRAAGSIDRFLRGRPVTPAGQEYNCSKGSLKEIGEEDYANVQRIPRVEMPTLDPGLKSGFDEYELGFSENMAQIEAGRCLSCGCQKAFDCTLRDLATRYEVTPARFAGQKHKRPVEEHGHPFIIRDGNKCILCGRCARICSEVAGMGVLSFVNRGFETIIAPTLGLPLQQTDCNACGLCISACPTGAIWPRVNLPKPGPWELDNIDSVCPGCDTGCNIRLQVKGNKIIRVQPLPYNSVESGLLCHKGSFGQYAGNTIKRIKTPHILRNGKLEEAAWEKAFQAIAGGLLRIRDERGGDRLAVLLSPRLTSQEIYLAQKMAGAALRTNNVGCLSVPVLNEAFHRYLGRDGSTSDFQAMAASDLIVVYNCEVEKHHPVVASKIRKAVSQGSRLVTLSTHQGSIDFMAGINLKVNRRTSLEVLNAILSYITEYGLVDHGFISSCAEDCKELAAELKQLPISKICEIPWVNPARLIEAANLYVRAKNPVILVDGDQITPAESAAISKLALITGNTGREGAGIIILRTHCNAQGLLDMYAATGQPRHCETAAAAAAIRPLNIIEEMEKGNIEGVVLIGNGAAGEHCNAIYNSNAFSVLIDAALPDHPPYPNVMLPGAYPEESAGTYTNCEGRVQRLHPAFPPPAGKSNWEIIAQLSGALGYSMDYSSLEEIEAECSKANISLCRRSAPSSS